MGALTGDPTSFPFTIPSVPDLDDETDMRSIPAVPGDDDEPYVFNVPAPPPRRADPPPDMMTLLIARGDTQKLRAYIEDSFWKGAPVRPAWEHIEKALKNGKPDMVRLLVVYGAQPGDGDLGKLKSDTGEAYPKYLRLLRRAGLPGLALAFGDSALSSGAVADDPGTVKAISSPRPAFL
ncbi:MAG: hypothetical protein GC185_01125 [Alphaproteobacteria bacterium]|nr:hypothetical protein [Alphaproteobacteria bacterium]